MYPCVPKPSLSGWQYNRLDWISVRWGKARVDCNPVPAPGICSACTQMGACHKWGVAKAFTWSGRLPICICMCIIAIVYADMYSHV